ncbi:NAD-dependent succinate-semialdehyde dehydrogenase [Pseudonocardia sp. CA-107938]|uniref:NAD-dependent succinate-semialdehyde dehydrogenase n=1 Tax=Pseudonocardia sp. CA-107938 TaxID=3240021 RepID=UPI003D8E2D32
MTTLAVGAAPAFEPGPTDLYIDGTFVPAQSGGRFAVLDPATDEILASVADADEHDARRALDAAVAASAAWASTAARDRGEILRRAFDLLMTRRERFAMTMSFEMGKPLDQAQGEIGYGGEFLRWFGEEAPRIAGRISDNPEGTGTMVIRRRPVGPCLLVTPWNFPLAMATRKIAPALAAGCTVVMKPAEQTPLTTLLLAELLAEAGVPDGVVNVVTTTRSPEVVGSLLDDPRLRKLSFTGSTRVGRELIARAGRNVLRTSMELGGNAPFLVFEDADLDVAVASAMLAKFRNMGQACTAANRFLVHRSISAAFTDRLVDEIAQLRVGPGTEPGVDIGPLITPEAVAEIERLVGDAARRGACVRRGGNALPATGSFYQPTVVTAVPVDSAICREEIFGPVLPIAEFDTEQEALRLANDTEYGLVAYAFTQDMSRVGRLMDGLETGMLGINTGIVSNAAAPFGGVKQSGTGREGGIEGIDEYLATTYTLVAR